MPRTIFDKPKKWDALKALVIGTAGVQGKKTAHLAPILDCAPSTVYSRMEDPGSFTLDEIIKLGRGLNIPIDELRQAIRY